jgi:glycosyltransferase involved in cell wall biosynthesis
MYTGTYAGVAETSRDFITYPGYLKLKYWDAHIFERLAGVHAESMAAGNQIADEVMERFGHKTTQMWLPVDMERFRPVDDKGPLRRKFGLPEGATVVSWIGNAMPYKGLHTVAELARRRRDLHWLLVARGGVPDDVKRLPNVTLIENMPYAELHQVYQASDLAITPYRIGPFCFTMAEAMATALPLLCSPAHGVPEFIKAGPLGVLVVDDQANVDGFMAALEAYQRDAQGMKADALALREEMRPLMDVADWNERLMAELERGLK